MFTALDYFAQVNVLLILLSRFINSIKRFINFIKSRSHCFEVSEQDWSFRPDEF